jgi:hypothetical protein
VVWILSANNEIVVDEHQVKARRDFIHDVTGVEVSRWSKIQVNKKPFLICMSYDNINGAFITAHIHDAAMLCTSPNVYTCEFVVANTCIWHKGANKEILKLLRLNNKNIELWFAEQALFVDGQILRQSTELNNVGLFGFQTSLSERNLFKNKNKGFMNAIQRSFVRVSPVIMGDYGVAL